MKERSKKIIKGLLLSATVALLHSAAKADAKKNAILESDLGLPNGDASSEVSKAQQPIVRNVYSIKRNGDARLIASHRSHSSHRSHRSSVGRHYSHSSSSSRYTEEYEEEYNYEEEYEEKYNYEGEYEYDEEYNNKEEYEEEYNYEEEYGYGEGSGYYGYGRSGSYGRGRGKFENTPSLDESETEFTLGDRTLSFGMYGYDVVQLVQTLICNNYLKDGVVTKKGDYCVYDGFVTQAVKSFQKEAGLPSDGKLDATTLEKLKSYNRNKR